MPLFPKHDTISSISLPIAEIDVDDEVPLPLTNPLVVDLLPLVVDMLPCVVCTFPAATTVPCVDILLFAIRMHASTYVPPEYGNAFVMLRLESVHTPFLGSVCDDSIDALLLVFKQTVIQITN